MLGWGGVQIRWREVVRGAAALWQLNFGCFSADGSLFACGGRDKKATVYETVEWTIVKELGHLGTLRFCTFSAGGALACGGDDKQATVYETGLPIAFDNRRKSKH